MILTSCPELHKNQAKRKRRRSGRRPKKKKEEDRSQCTEILLLRKNNNTMYTSMVYTGKGKVSKSGMVLRREEGEVSRRKGEEDRGKENGVEKAGHRYEKEGLQEKDQFVSSFLGCLLPSTET